MVIALKLAGLAIDVQRKPVKHLHLGVYPPDGRVRVVAPEEMSAEAIRLFAIGKLAWIKRQQQKFATQLREPAPEYLPRESHYVWGRRYLLAVHEVEHAPSVELRPRRLQLNVRSGSSPARREALLEDWYRSLLREAAAPLIAKWQPIMKVKVRGVFVQRMKTKWGSCNPVARTIRLNSELAKKPIQYLEYVIVHEMAHIRVPTHGPRFVALMDQLMPNWRDVREGLNQLPLQHSEWND